MKLKTLKRKLMFVKQHSRVASKQNKFLRREFILICKIPEKAPVFCHNLKVNDKQISMKEKEKKSI